MIKEFRNIQQVTGPLLMVEISGDVMYGEIAEIITPSGEKKTGQVLEVGDKYAVLQIFEGSSGVDVDSTRVRFKGKTLMLKVGTDMLGRVFGGSGKPIDGRPAIIPEKELDVNGASINPCRREYPRDFIQTGVSCIDIMNTLVRGQKLPIFSGSGLPHNMLAAQITRQAKVLSSKEKFGVVFAAMGITNEEAIFFKEEFKKMESAANSVMFLNLADDPAIERIITPRIALTCAEYLAFEKDMHVLVILTDMTNYCEALREISAARNEVPGRKGYPGYMYTDLAAIYERAGKIQGKNGSITMIPILSMPSDDITHPIADLTGYITEGQIVLNRELHMKAIYPPNDVLPSLSRLMKTGIGPGKTREDHADVSNQIYAMYAKGRELRNLVAVIGVESLDDTERRILEFADVYEKELLAQDYNEERSVIESLDLCWKLLSSFPKSDLTRIKEELIEKYMGKTQATTSQKKKAEAKKSLGKKATKKTSLRKAKRR